MKKIIIALTISLACSSLQAQHLVTLKTGEKMNGKVQSMKDGVISFEFKGNIMKLNVADVSSIIFSDSPETAKPANPETLRRETGEKQIMADPYLVRYKVADRTITKAPLVSNL